MTRVLPLGMRTVVCIWRVKNEFTEAMIRGDIFVWDEYDKMPKDLKNKLNAALQERKIVLQDGTVIPFHEDALVIATSNPPGSGNLTSNAPGPQASRFNHEPKRTRKLLVHKREAAKLAAAIQREGMTLIPLKMYFNAKGKAKLELGIAKGKKLHDKRETEKQRDWQRDKARLLRDKG